MSRLNFRAVVFSLFIFAFVIFAFGGQLKDSQAENLTKVQIDSVLASASMWSNARGGEDSLKVRSASLLKKALDYKLVVPPGCTVARPRLIFSTEPNVVLKDSADRDYCDVQFKKTANNPLSFSPHTFLSPTELSEWFADFAQGKGDDGKELYEKCDKSCSPRYNTIIEVATDGALKVRPLAICGLPRDRNDNQYRLTATWEWHCS